MGVLRLLSTLLDHHSQCAENTDLIMEAKRQWEGIEIICDFSNFKYRVMVGFWKSASKYTQNNYVQLLGGEYKLIDQYFRKLITHLQSLQIYLVMVVDGANGSSKQEAKVKMETWKSRCEEKMHALEKLPHVCSGKQEMDTLRKLDSFLPALLEVQILETTRRCGCEVIQCGVGEADYIIAKTYRERRPRAFAILSNDSDFGIFPDSTFIPDGLFDTGNDLKLGEHRLPQKPKRLTCEVVTSARVAALFKFTDESKLVELSILAGNDFTRPHINPSTSRRNYPKIHKRLGLDKFYPEGLDRLGPDMFSFARWVRENRFVDRHPAIKFEMTCNPELRDALRQSRQFYSTNTPPEGVNLNGELSRIIRERIEDGQYPDSFMAMHQNVYWHRIMLEDVSGEVRTVEQALAPLRSYIYRMLLPRSGDDTVMEYGLMISGRDPLCPEPVQASVDLELPAVDEVDSEDVDTNLALFARIMTHQETEYPVDFFYGDYGEPCDGFLYYCLRYLLRLCAGDYINLRRDEFEAIFASVFCEVDETWYQGVSILPSARCITLNSLFQNIYRHAYHFLGKLLYLTSQFPEPKDVFSGAVFTAFYMTRIHPDTLESNKFLAGKASQIRRDCDRVLKKKRRIVRRIIQGITMN